MTALLLTMSLALLGSFERQTGACCTVTAIDAATSLVSAKVTASGQVFQFKAPDPRTLAGIRTGQGVWANFTTKQASLDGRSSCCTITSGPSAPTAASLPAPAGRTPPPQPAQTAPAAAATNTAVPVTSAISNVLPSVTFGTPVPRNTVRSRATSRYEQTAVTAQVSGRSMTSPVLYLRGLKAVEQAPGLPDDAKRVLEMLVRRVPLGESDHYIVNPQMARDWVAAHDVPDNVKPTEPSSKKCDNWYDSWDCAGQAISDEWQRTYDHAVKEWSDATETLASAWQTTAACFTERTISSGDIPVRFTITPSMRVDLSQSGSKGSAQGTVSGNATLGIPMTSDVAARLDLFYIPCLPFAVRPKALAGDGILTVGEELGAQVTATGSFNRTFTLPPTGGPVIPIQVIPIVIGGVPVAEMDISAYIEGNIEVSASGRADGQFKVTNTHPTRFGFACSGKGCSATSKALPSATTTNESAQIQGSVTLKPALYTALQIDFDYEALSARIGPQPYLTGTGSGCIAAAGSQSSTGPSVTQENHLLSADLDWGTELRAEALVLGKIVGSPFVTKLMNERHLWFRDLAPGGSNALTAVAESTGQAAAAKPATFKVRMPSCFPYGDDVKYRVAWTGNAVPAPVSQCTWQTGQGSCTFAPGKDLAIALSWPAAGTYSLSVTATGDTHQRTFAAPAAQVTVNVSP